MTFVLSILAVLAGLAVVGFALARRLGVSPGLREWATHSEESARVTLLTMPGGGMLLMALGFVGLAGRYEAVTPLVGVFAVLAVPVVLYAALRLPLPLWIFPAWARAQRSRVRSRRKS